jgi:hypothetical protein
LSWALPLPAALASGAAARVTLDHLADAAIVVDLASR